MRSLKSILLVGALAIGLPLGTASVAMADEAAKPGKPGVISFGAAALAETADQAIRLAQDGVDRGIAEHEKRTGTTCKKLGGLVSVEKKSETLYLGSAYVKAACRKG
ncbi:MULTISPECIES: hypothetical protein [unclassified Crossiella]|uniref:hypothetical protein n=1 Tax=unclassified Crossiella TaxID=2620835 RepID=UPI001FFF582E|nr:MULTISPECIES: hypothetical protein [unclassified Crossiella]MCK2243954.1 hypothetical protein [Crossiella sp. S99.2]MCK2257188.1 hypothetical protein [Crossiella sp. S99.1]